MLEVWPGICTTPDWDSVLSTPVEPLIGALENTPTLCPHRPTHLIAVIAIDLLMLIKNLTRLDFGISWFLDPRIKWRLRKYPDELPLASEHSLSQ
ncbi:hypothetical protein [Nitrosomonas supralitoralis]|uniref:hypothetical protein n=1 Tax=Nitrosomonas supralitoralis TaxID=2116706 RepID=UPI0011C4A663|nr:hypothetical protein [Nitrosomonas supralitoralis]